VDTLATCAALLGRELPRDAGPDSFNILPALLGEKRDKPIRDYLVEQGNRAAIRNGPWKLVTSYAARAGEAKGKENVAPELYNLADDLAETKNLADQHPEKVRELTAWWEQIRESGRSRP